MQWPHLGSAAGVCVCECPTPSRCCRCWPLRCRCRWGGSQRDSRIWNESADAAVTVLRRCGQLCISVLHSPAVLTERMNAVPAVLVPQLHRLIIAGRHNQTPIRGKPTGFTVNSLRQLIFTHHIINPCATFWTFLPFSVLFFWSFCLCYWQLHTFWHRCVFLFEFDYFTPFPLINLFCTRNKN